MWFWECTFRVETALGIPTDPALSPPSCLYPHILSGREEEARPVLWDIQALPLTGHRSQKSWPTSTPAVLTTESRSWFPRMWSVAWKHFPALRDLEPQHSTHGQRKEHHPRDACAWLCFSPGEGEGLLQAWWVEGYVCRVGGGYGKGCC